MVSIVLVVIGLLHIISPYTAWYLTHGWRYRDAEPSKLALWVIRIGGAVFIVLAAVIAFTS